MSKKNDEQKQSYLRLMNKTEDYIERHLDSPLSLKELAQHACFSEYHFHRLFKKYANETLKHFVTRFKLERAAIFLAINQNISLTEIALSYGYNDSSSFGKAFTRHFGISPAKYRKEQEMTSSYKKIMR